MVVDWLSFSIRYSLPRSVQLLAVFSFQYQQLSIHTMPRLSKIGYRSLLQGSETESKASDEPSISESAQDKIQIQWPQSNGPRHSIRWATWILATLIFVNVVFLTLNISKLSHPDPHSACWSNSNGKYQRPHRNLILKETSAYCKMLILLPLLSFSNFFQHQFWMQSISIYPLKS